MTQKTTLNNPSENPVVRKRDAIGEETDIILYIYLEDDSLS